MHLLSIILLFIVAESTSMYDGRILESFAKLFDPLFRAVGKPTIPLEYDCARVSIVMPRLVFCCLDIEWLILL